MIKKIITDDGSLSFINEDVDESYHSKTGAIEEAFLKFVKPCVDGIFEYYNKNNIIIKNINSLDLFFGFGYNTLCLIYYLKEIKFYKEKIKIFASEIDPNIKNFMKEIKFDENQNTELLKNSKILIDNKKLNDYYKLIIDIIKNNKIIENIEIKLIIGDAREILKENNYENKKNNYENNFKNYKFDCVFFDPFSPKKQPELWTKEIFKNIYKNSNDFSILTTYSCSRIAKDGLIEANYKIENGPCVGRRAPSIIAVKHDILSI